MDRKKEWIRFRIYDFEGIEKHLEEMAASGWMLSSAGSFFWNYEKCEPKSVKFTLHYKRDGGHIFSAGNAEEDYEACELAKERGWRHIDTWNDVRIFFTEDENAKPLYDDVKEKIEACRTVVNRGLLVSHTILTILMAMMAYGRIRDIFLYPLDSLSGYSSIFAAVALLVGLIVISANLIAIIRWLNRAENGKADIKVNTKLYQVMDAIAYILVGAGVIGFLLSIAGESGEGEAVESAGLIVIVLILSVIVSKVFAELRRKNVKGIAMVGAFAASFIVIFAVLAAYTFIPVMSDKPVEFPESAVTYEDITGQEIQRDNEICSYSEGESIFLKKIYVDEYGEIDEHLEYYIADIKKENMYDWFLNKALMEETYWLQGVFNGAGSECCWNEEQDLAWGADKVYVMDDDPDRWILAKGSRIINLELDFTPTDKQKAEIVKMLEEEIDHEA